MEFWGEVGIVAVQFYAVHLSKKVAQNDLKNLHGGVIRNLQRHP